MLNEIQIKSMAGLFREGMLSNPGITKEFADYLNYIIDKCTYFSESDNDTDKIFKLYICYGNIQDVPKNYGYSQREISDTLYYRQANDIRITLLAKAIYAYSGTKYHEFLKLQVDVILKNGSINIENEFEAWTNSPDKPKVDIFDF